MAGEAFTVYDTSYMPIYSSYDMTDVFMAVYGQALRWQRSSQQVKAKENVAGCRPNQRVQREEREQNRMTNLTNMRLRKKVPPQEEQILQRLPDWKITTASIAQDEVMVILLPSSWWVV